MITLITPLVTALVYNEVLPNDQRALLLAISVLLIGATVTWGLVALSRNLVTVRIEGQLEMHLDPGLTDRLLQLPSGFFRRYSTGDLATRAGGLQLIRQQLSGAVVTSALALVFSLLNVALLFVFSPLLGIASLVTIAAMVAILVGLNVVVVRQQYEVYTASGNVASELFQVIRGVHKMRVAGAEPRLMARWASLFRLPAAGGLRGREDPDLGVRGGHRAAGDGVAHAVRDRGNGVGRRHLVRRLHGDRDRTRAVRRRGRRDVTHAWSRADGDPVLAAAAPDPPGATGRGRGSSAGPTVG